MRVGEVGACRGSVHRPECTEGRTAAPGLTRSPAVRRAPRIASCIGHGCSLWGSVYIPPRVVVLHTEGSGRDQRCRSPFQICEDQISTSQQGVRTIVDKAGVTWTVTEAYQMTAERGASSRVPAGQTVAVLWFETQSGRTASAHLPAGSLASVSDEDLLEFLCVAVARHGRQP